jgi:hypothetical protein
MLENITATAEQAERAGGTTSTWPGSIAADGRRAPMPPSAPAVRLPGGLERGPGRAG